MASKLDPSRTLQSTYLRVKNQRGGGGPVPLRNWVKLEPPAIHRARPQQRTGKDTGVI